MVVVVVVVSCGGGELSGMLGSPPTKLPLMILYNLSVPASLNCPSIFGVTRKISACFLKPKLAKATYIQENPWMSACRVPQNSPSDASVPLPATTSLGAMASPACANGVQCCFYGATQQQVPSQSPFNNLSALT